MSVCGPTPPRNYVLGVGDIVETQVFADGTGTSNGMPADYGLFVHIQNRTNNIYNMYIFQAADGAGGKLYHASHVRAEAITNIRWRIVTSEVVT